MERAFLPFELAGQRLLLDAVLVREILGEVEPVAIPQADRQLPGVFLWNSQATPFLNLASCLTLKSRAVAGEKSGRTIVTRVAKETVGFGADAVGEVVRLAEATMTEVRVHSLPFALAEVEVDGQVSTVLDLAELVTHVLGLQPNAPLR